MKKQIGVAAILVAAGVAVWMIEKRSAAKGVSIREESRVLAMARPQDATPTVAAGTQSQEVPNRPSSHTTEPAPASVSAAEDTPTLALSSRGTTAFRIASTRTLTPEVRAALTGYGAREIAMLGGKGMIVEATPAVRKRIAADTRFEIAPMLPADKVADTLAALCEQAKDSDTLEITVEGLAAEDADALKAYIAQAGGTPSPSPCGEGIFRAKVTPETVRNLAERGDVRWLEKAPHMVFLNDQSIKANGANIEGVRTTARGLTGAGQIVCVADSGLDNGKNDTTLNADFQGRVLSLTCLNSSGSLADDAVSHGTHVAGTVLGSGANSNGKYKGMAPEAKLVFQSGGDGTGGLDFGESTYNAMFNGASSLGAYIHSDSWGAETGDGSYDNDCAAFDTYLWSHPRMLAVVAAGNDGANGVKSVGSPATAKNVLAVGNTVSARPSSTLPSGTLEVALGATVNNLSPSSSRGPTTDGRNKPDLCAPGTCIVSVRGSNSTEPMWDNSKVYAPMTGTSMATPLVSGAAALTREWLLKTRNIKYPSSALMKAILAGGSEMMTGKGGKCSNDNWTTFNLPKTRPNTDTGYGRLNLADTLYPSGLGVMLVDNIPAVDGGTNTYTITTTASASLDVMLAWIDYPAAASAKTTLINDLDLVLVDQNGNEVYGNQGDDFDRKNNMEGVHFDSVDAGVYTIHVIGYSISHSYTEGGAVALYVRGAFADATSATDTNSGAIASGVGTSGTTWKTSSKKTYSTSKKSENGHEDEEEDDDECIDLGPVESDEMEWIATDVKVVGTGEGVKFSVYLADAGTFEVRAGNTVLWSSANSTCEAGEYDWEDVDIDLPEGAYTLGFYYLGDENCTDKDYVSIDDIAFTDGVTETDDVGDSTETTPTSVPHDWLDKYYPDSEVGYEKLAGGKGANGRAVWESYVLGLDPTNTASEFVATITITNGLPQIGWVPELDATATDARLYTIYGKPSLTNEWEAIGNNYDPPSEEDLSANKFFKVGVEVW